MKPHRIRITHDLVTAYGMLDKMHILVSTLVFWLCGGSAHADRAILLVIFPSLHLHLHVYELDLANSANFMCAETEESHPGSDELVPYGRVCSLSDKRDARDGGEADLLWDEMCVFWFSFSARLL